MLHYLTAQDKQSSCNIHAINLTQDDSRLFPSIPFYANWAKTLYLSSSVNLLRPWCHVSTLSVFRVFVFGGATHWEMIYLDSTNPCKGNIGLMPLLRDFKQTWHIKVLIMKVIYNIVPSFKLKRLFAQNSTCLLFISMCLFNNINYLEND